MDHEAYENEMIDGVNRHAGKWDQLTFDYQITDTAKGSPTKNKDVKTLRRGLKRMLVAIFTAVLFALSVFCFIEVAMARGYWAVILFFSAVVLMFWAFILLYAQGITDTESKGDDQ